MNQGGKNASGEPAGSETKRDRRRGAAGRASVLRRAPSDSDCSGETASLSADSGDRAPRPAPLAPPRSGKTRSRRRGSEWEVLEGLKDGQRFEKRPDVFNGYLHKKRKWPLKGWHKRFFVVDGGILVYARSPTDVARGRLHGSVDVGLSVISAKARRRRIDIDADEFIYHLRAKTPEVFRTWLNVLKAHRLYRQHLLTFGARESVPKIHPPLDDLPATDNSSHTSFNSAKSSETSENPSPDTTTPIIPLSPLEIEPSEYNNNDHSSIFKWQLDPPSTNSLLSLNFECFQETSDLHMKKKMFDLHFENSLYHRSMCSMKCIANNLGPTGDIKSPTSINTTDAEKQINCTDLNPNTPGMENKKLISSVIDKPIRLGETIIPRNCNVNSIANTTKPKDIFFCQNKVLDRKHSPTIHKNNRPATMACFFFTRKKNHIDHADSLMKKSKKCTNLVKYKNVSEEPPLRAQTSKCMLLGKFKLTVNDSDTRKSNRKLVHKIVEQKYKAVACNVDPVQKESNEVQVMTEKANKGSQKVTVPEDYDKITEHLMLNIFRRCDGSKEHDVRFYIDQVVHDLYDVKLNQDMHPVKALFRNLLEYWLKNTSITCFKEAMTTEKAVYQSKNNLTKDANISSFLIQMKSQETQFRGTVDPAVHKYNKMDVAATTTNDIITSTHTMKHRVKEIKCETKGYSPNSKRQSTRLDTASFEKERRIQELERLLKSTVYVCEMGGNNINKEKDIQMTKRLIDNIGLHSECNVHKRDSNGKQHIEKSSSSAELPEIQATINHLLSETSIPSDVAKEFLGAYLDVLLQKSSKSTGSSQSSDWNKEPNDIKMCEVVGEAVVKKVSKSVTTLNVVEKDIRDEAPKLNKTEQEMQIDPGQIYLKDILEKVTTLFSKLKNVEDNNLIKTVLKEDSANLENYNRKTIKDELGRPVIKSKYDFIYENYDQNSLVIDLSKYNLEHISMFNDPAIKDMMSITIKLKEKSSNHNEDKPTRAFKFPDYIKPITVTRRDEKSKSSQNILSNDIFQTVESNKMVCNIGTKVQNIRHRPYFSNISEGTSKARSFFSDNSCDSSDVPLTIQSNFSKDLVEKSGNEELQSCYLLSIKKGGKFQSKRNVADNDVTMSEDYTPNKIYKNASVLEKPTSKIVDEKFVLLLLENLAYISKSVTSMHKDINALYVKLKKKHEKSVKTSNYIQGLSLLGKIYSEDTFSKDGDDKATECDLCICDDFQKHVETKHASTNTNINRIGERSACTCTHTPMITNFAVQTDDSVLLKSCSCSEMSSDIKYPLARCEMTVTETNTVDINTADHSTSNPNWHRPTTTETAVNTIVRYVFKDTKLRTVMIPTRPYIFERDFKRRLTSNRVKEELIKEMSLLAPLFKVSTQSQTDEKLPHLRSPERDYKDYTIYQLFKSKKCGVKTSSSLTCSTVEMEMSDEVKTLFKCSSDPSYCSGLLSPTTPTMRGPQAGFVSGTPGGRFQGWIIESGGPLDSAARELGQAQLSVQQLRRLLDALELQHQAHHDTDVSLEGASPNVKKDRRKFGLRKKKSNSKCASVELMLPHMDPSASHTASLSALTAPPSPGGGPCSMPNSAASLPIACAAARPQSLPGAETLNTAQGPASISSLTPDHQLREDFTVLAKDLVASLKGVVSSLVCERGRLRAALESAEATVTPSSAIMAALRTNLTSALHQNSELRTRLSRIHDTSDIAEIISVPNSESVTRQYQQSLSYSSSCVSASEFFDAEEHEEDDLKQDDVIATDEAGVIELDGDSSSEAGSLSSEEGSASSDNSDGAMLSAEQVTLRHNSANGPRPSSCWTRRTRLPAPRPSPGGPSLWNLLYKNIGKDLSQISMPVTINEPLNMLQRLCEELEYSELLDTAAACGNSVERAALIAAFAVSAYAASAHRAASKPFNPLLAETYECVRDDRGFRFLAEQVSHHPPISVCHAESQRWCFWQEARIKTKFWGKSMEFQPTGRVHVRLHTTGDHYTWNKVTTCVHNLFGGQRWVDQYGDMHIVCIGTDISCKLNFVKASSWSHTRHEVRGAVTDASSGARLRLAGRWSEALYAGEPPAARCLWRTGAMPPEHELYYGFTRFAMELNEVEPGMREVLPQTDTRLRPDQRALEEGDVDSAESYKHSLEQSQRERRRESLTHHPAWFRKVIEDGEETWVFSGEYWKVREAGFSENVAQRIW